MRASEQHLVPGFGFSLNQGEVRWERVGTAFPHLFCLPYTAGYYTTVRWPDNLRNEIVSGDVTFDQINIFPVIFSLLTKSLRELDEMFSIWPTGGSLEALVWSNATNSVHYYY